ncbi:MAG: flagellar hook-associated protein FlgL [Vulcanimicrobiaceae bacterium]
MRIATSTIFDSQTAAIDNLVAQQQQQGAVLSSGKQVNQPSDDPTQIAQDLSVRTSIAQENQTSTNVQSITAEMTTVDGALSSLSSLMQSARSIAVQAANDTISASQRQALATQADSLLQEAVGLANTQYAGKYVFAGTANPQQKPVVSGGQPITSVAFNGNLSGQSQQLTNGQVVQTSLTLQQAFNFSSTDGSPDVFQTLINLRDTLQNGTVADTSSSAINKAGTSITTLTALNSANFLTGIVPDSSGKISISIASASAPNGVPLTFAPTDTIQGTPTSVINQINGQTAVTGVTASFDPKSERITLTSASGAFTVTDVPSPGAINASNFVAAFNLTSQADLVGNISGQIGDVDRALQTVVNARAVLGSNIQTVTSVGNTASSQVVNDTKVQSSIEGADIPKVVSQFSQTQTALQAAYGTTTRLESKTLFDYLQ